MARGVPCGKEEVDFHRSGVKLKFPISYDWFTLRRRGKKIQPRRVFKKEVSYPAVIKSIDRPYISSPHLSPLPVATPMVCVRGLGSKVFQVNGDTRCVIRTIIQAQGHVTSG